MAKRPNRRSAPASGIKFGGGRPQGNAPSRQPDRDLSRAGTRGSGGDGTRSLLLWSAIFGVVAIVVVGAAFVLSQSKSAVAGGLSSPAVYTPADIPTNGRTIGQPGAPVTIDIYGDFRCSACFAFTVQGTEKSLMDNYIATGHAKLVWHDLLSIDGRDGSTASRDAANAAWCAADQGKFWIMHDWLYANQSPTEDASAFTPARLADIARAAGLDMSTFQPCLDGGTHDAAIATEQSTIPSQATGTPAIFVDGKFVGDPAGDSIATYAQISAAIDAEIAKPGPS